ncbi:MAG: hypothetical protein M3R52_06165 [Acidobacteriota bacterium]|nr:hypothetical protein [Acidobacteriota bacterium]
MPVVITDIQLAFVAGAFLTDLGAPVIEAASRESEASLCKVYNNYMVRSLVYAGVFIGPVATVFYLAYPAWETQYTSAVFEATLRDPANASYYGIFLMLVFIAGWLGNWLGFRWVLQGGRKRLRFLYTLVLLITFAIFFLRYPAPVRVGSYAAFKANPNSLPFVTEDKTFLFAFVVLLLVDVVPLVIWFIQIRTKVRQVRQASA